MTDRTAFLNTVIKRLFLDLTRSVDDEAETMLIMEQLLLGVMLRYRPDPQHAAEFLDSMTESVIRRLPSEGAP